MVKNVGLVIDRGLNICVISLLISWEQRISSLHKYPMASINLLRKDQTVCVALDYYRYCVTRSLLQSRPPDRKIVIIRYIEHYRRWEPLGTLVGRCPYYSND
ncbi:10386_t:CDS:2 [Acaulospora morrowiae]|uniref:10386_t:CDS:1 n=1 Tax=Acaulospora morrowiae TaxID=94023 RepID=A0A9N9ECQ6_9GLOM|nr:10386_t:CDS:2 [Acaulospora morrowiae]